MSLVMFVVVGAFAGALVWWGWRHLIPKAAKDTVTIPGLQHAFPMPGRERGDSGTAALPTEPRPVTDQHTSLEANHLPNVADALPQPRIINLPPPESRARDAALIARANVLAERLVDFADERDNVAKKFEKDYWAAAKDGRLPPKPWEDRDRDLQASLKEFDQEASARVTQLYWPSVMTLTEDMAAAGVDISPVSRVSATSGARLIGLRLSMLATHVGKDSPFDRVLTPLMARAVVKGLVSGTFEVWAFGRDSNSQRVAQNLREAMEIEGWSVQSEVRLFYPTKAPIYRGIRVIYPFPDLASMDDIAPALNICGLKAETIVETMPSNHEAPAKLGPWGKIEVWPTPLPQP